jgi:hypothetical protein
LRAGLALVCAAWLCACSPPATEEAQPPAASVAGERASAAAATDVLSAEGYGPLHIGMTLEAAREATGQPMYETPIDEDSAACNEQAFSTPAGDTLYLMFENGRLTRITASERGAHARMANGLGVDSSEADVRAAFPNAVEQAAFYDGPPSRELVAWLRPDTSGYRFEITGNGRVHTVHAGGPSILYVEGCA